MAVWETEYRLKGFESTMTHCFESFKEAIAFREFLMDIGMLQTDSFVITSPDGMRTWGTNTIDISALNG